MTIELGFAWFEAENGEQVGIVDVPGHRDFVENMLAGIGGIDAVLLVIAADEGVMPQTKEHLAIINLLKINTGIVVLTKIDQVDLDWLDLVETEVKAAITGSVLDQAEIVRVSAITGEGIPTLKAKISKILSNTRPRPDLGKPRLPVDRVFSISGFGTVVTGTLLGGVFHVGDLVEIPLSGKTGRIRGIQSHKQAEEKAIPGSRTALNISGIDVNEIHRGDTVTMPGSFKPTTRIDALIEVLPDTSTGIKHNDSIKLFLNTSERSGRIRLLQKKIVPPGDQGWVQIEFDQQLITEEGDRFVIRRMSPPETLGGGVVVGSHPRGRYRLSDAEIVRTLEMKLEPASADQLFLSIDEHQFMTIQEIKASVPVDEPLVFDDLKTLLDQNRLIQVKESTKKMEIYFSIRKWNQLVEKLTNILNEFHQRNPIRAGVSKTEIASQLNLPASVLQGCLDYWVNKGTIKLSDGFLSLPSNVIKYSPAQTRRVELLLSQIDEDPYNPPSVKEVKELLENDLYQSLIDRRILIQVSQDVVFRKSEYEHMLDYVVEIGAQDQIFSYQSIPRPFCHQPQIFPGFP